MNLKDKTREAKAARGLVDMLVKSKVRMNGVWAENAAMLLLGYLQQYRRGLQELNVVNLAGYRRTIEHVLSFMLKQEPFTSADVRAIKSIRAYIAQDADVIRQSISSLRRDPLDQSFQVRPFEEHLRTIYNLLKQIDVHNCEGVGAEGESARFIDEWVDMHLCPWGKWSSTAGFDFLVALASNYADLRQIGPYWLDSLERYQQLLYRSRPYFISRKRWLKGYAPMGFFYLEFITRVEHDLRDISDLIRVSSGRIPGYEEVLLTGRLHVAECRKILELPFPQPNRNLAWVPVHARVW